MIKKLTFGIVLLIFLATGCSTPSAAPYSTGPSSTVAEILTTAAWTPPVTTLSPAPTSPATQSTIKLTGTTLPTTNTTTAPAITPITMAPSSSIAISTTSAAPPTSNSQAPGETTFLVKTSNMFSNTQLQVVAVLTDPDGNILNFDGVVTAHMWQNPDPTLLGKGDLLQQWEDIPLTEADHFEEDLGKWIAFDFDGFYPKEVQSVYLDVTLVTGGIVYQWEGKMPLTTEAA